MPAYALENTIPVFTPQSPFAVWNAAKVGAADAVTMALTGFNLGRIARTIPAPSPAYKGPQWQDVYYPQLVFSPSSIDVGLVSSTVYVTINFWNASDSPLTISSITAGGADGVSVSGLSLPRTLRPTEEGKIVFMVSESGLPIIDAVFTFNTDEGATSAEITGMRGIILPFMPDWSQPFKVSRFRKTVRLASLSTSEERSSMESQALSKLSFQVLAMSATEEEQLKHLILQIGSNLVGVPLWPEGLQTTAAVSAAATILPTDSTDLYNIGAGDLVMVWDDPKHWVLKTVDSIQAASICIAQTVGSSFASGAWVVPVLTGKLTSRPEFTHVTDEVAQAQIDFEEQV